MEEDNYEDLLNLDEEGREITHSNLWKDGK